MDTPSNGHLQKPKYLTVADSELRSFVTQFDFEKSLLLNILFQPEVLIPDSFCFSETIRTHVTSYSEGQSLFEAAIKCGAMRIAFRSPHDVSFPTLFEAIAGSGIIARSDKARTQSKIVAYRLQQAADNPLSKFKPAYWPLHSVGEAFASLAKASLAYEEMPDIFDTETPINTNTWLKLRQTWDETKKWRIDAIGRALERTQTMEGAGLRRIEIIRVVGEMLNVPKERIEQTDYLADLSAFASDQDRPALEHFYRWVNYLYNLNLADQLGAIPNFPDYEPFDAIIGVRALHSRPPSASPPLTSSIYRLVLNVPVPRLQTLLAMRPTNLLDIRYDLGHRYLAAVNSWKVDPGAEQQKEVEDALNHYAQALVQWASRERDSGLTTLRVEYIRQLSPRRAVLKVAPQLASPAERVKKVGPNAISTAGSLGTILLTPLSGLAATSLNLGLAIYRLLPLRSECQNIELNTYKAPAAKTVVEVDLPSDTHDDSTVSEGRDQYMPTS